MRQRNVSVVKISFLKILDLNLKSMFVIDVMSFNDFAIAYVKRSSYRINFWYTSKDDAMNIMKNSNLVDKSGVL